MIRTLHKPQKNPAVETTAGQFSFESYNQISAKYLMVRTI